MNVNHLSSLSLLPDSEGTTLCDIIHMRSESEGRPERTFQLCCRYTYITYPEPELKLQGLEQKAKCLVFCPICSSPDSKKDFLKAIHSILRQKQRRQLMKNESLPPNQQYVPFGGKRLCALKGARPSVNRAGNKAQACPQQQPPMPSKTALIRQDYGLLGSRMLAADPGPVCWLGGKVS